MSDEPRAERPERDVGGTTHPSGTPMAVDLRSDPETRRAMAAFVAGPVVWFAHFMIVYLVAEAGCTGDGPGLELFDPPVPAVVTIVVTVVAALACLWVVRWEYRRWRSQRRTPDRDQTVPDSAEPEAGAPLSFAGLLLGAVSFISVLFVGLPALVLTGC